MKLALASAATLLTVLSTSPAHADSDLETVAASEPETEPVMARVRLTYYAESGRTYSGQQTYAGSTACSWNFELGQRFLLPNGEVVTCNDRGLLGNGNPTGWLDIWRRKDLADMYGPYATVEVLP